MNGTQIWIQILGGMFGIAIMGFLAVPFITAPICRILNSAWNRSISDEFRIISGSPVQRYIRFLFWRQKWNYVLFLSIVGILVTLAFWDFSQMQFVFSPQKIFLVIYCIVFFGCIGTASGILCLSHRKSAINYSSKVIFLQLVCSFLFPSPIFIGMVFDQKYSFPPLVGFICGLLPIIIALSYLLVSIIIFYFRLGKVDDLLGEGIGMLEGKSA
ncbi:MAG: hypothetical protein SFY68_12270 [Candidatus Sumerlaeia bacterium]|nr:hypothetical protein [Candidatus Sumerlaeia bacterium]